MPKEDGVHNYHFGQLPEMPYKTEIWKDIPGWEGIYQVSTFGHIKRKGSTKALKPSIKNGYFFVVLSSKGKQKNYYIHRLMAMAFLDLDTSQDLEVNHKDLNKTNNLISNLEVIYPFENYHHAADNGKCGKYKRKLSSKDILEIRRLRALGFSNRKIGEMFDVSDSHVSGIARRKSWKHIK